MYGAAVGKSLRGRPHAWLRLSCPVFITCAYKVINMVLDHHNFMKIFLSQDYTPRNTYSRPIRIPSPFRLNRITVLLVSDILHTPSVKTRVAAVTRYRWGSAAVCIIPFLTGLAYVHLTISFPTALSSPSAISRT